MNTQNIKWLVALSGIVALSMPGVGAQTNSQDSPTNVTREEAASPTEQTAPLGIMSPTAPTIDTIDGTGLRNATAPTIDTIDGTGLRNATAPTIDTIDGTGLRNATAPTIDTIDGTGLLRQSSNGTETIDGTGGPLRAPETDLAASGETLLTVPASTRSSDCTEIAGASSADSSNCETDAESIGE